MNRISIALDDKEITRVRRLSVTKNVAAEADMFEFEIENSHDRYTKIFHETQGDLIEVKIDGLVCFAGFVDTADFRYFPEETITVAGRDYTGLLIDEIVSKVLALRFASKTASQIVEQVAKYYGYTSAAQRTSAVYLEEKLYAEGTAVWEVIRTLAEKEGYDAWVTKDKVIVFKKREMPTDVRRVLSLESKDGVVPNLLEISQDKTLSLSLKVRVIGYDPKAKVKLCYTAESSKRTRSTYKIATVRDFTLKNKAEVKARAEALLRDYSKDLTVGNIRIPVDPEIEPGDAIDIKGIELAGRYFVTDVLHNLDTAGFTTEVRFASKVLTEVKTVEDND